LFFLSDQQIIIKILTFSNPALITLQTAVENNSMYAFINTLFITSTLYILLQRCFVYKINF